jgi:hypothetical protein
MTGWTVTSSSCEGSRMMRVTPRRASTSALRTDHQVRAASDSSFMGGDVEVEIMRALLSRRRLARVRWRAQ